MRRFYLSLISFFVITNAFAQELSSKSDSTKIVDTVNMAKICVIRSTGHVGSAINLRVLVDEVPYCKVKNNRFALFYVQPGTHMFYATTWDKPAARDKFALEMPVEAGKTYYLSMRIKPRFMTTEIFLEEITNNTAMPFLSKHKQDKCD